MAPKTSKAQAAAPAKPAKKATAIREKMTKAKILAHIATETDLTQGQVGSVLDSLELLVLRHIKKRAVGEFTLPQLMTIRSAKRPATKKRMGRNPKTGEAVEIPAKPATTVVRVKPLKRLRDMVL